MPLTTNTTYGTVNYSPEGFFNQGGVLQNDTSDLVHTGLTAVSGRGYFIDTENGAVTVTLPSDPNVNIGDKVAFK